MSVELIAQPLPEEKALPLWGHVGELRERLINSVLAVFIVTAAGYCLRFRLWEAAKRPLLQAIARRSLESPEMFAPFAYTNLSEPFFALMRLSFWASVFVSSPYWFYQLWAFVRPALREKERKMATVFVAATSLCFIFGAVFAYSIAFPILADVLMDEAFKAGLRPNLRPNEYLDILLYTVLGVGIAFEAPVLFYFLGRFGLVTSRAMLSYWRQAAVVILAASALLTPGDIIATTILFGVVLLVLYFVSTGVVWFVERRAARP
ncbi:MAG: twin-arginine translocase subunit TatC [Elusimicrobiota bacterium]